MIFIFITLFTMDFQGIVKFVWAIEQVSEKTKKQTIVVEEMQGQFPQSMSIDMLNDKIKLSETLKVGDVVNVSVNFRSNEGTEWRHFNSINGWKVALIAKSASDEAAE